MDLKINFVFFMVHTCTDVWGAKFPRHVPWAGPFLTGWDGFWQPRLKEPINLTFCFIELHACKTCSNQKTLVVNAKHVIYGCISLTLRSFARSTSTRSTASWLSEGQRKDPRNYGGMDPTWKNTIVSSIYMHLCMHFFMVNICAVLSWGVMWCVITCKYGLQILLYICR